jgi:hypothetical protein
VNPWPRPRDLPARDLQQGDAIAYTDEAGAYAGVVHVYSISSSGGTTSIEFVDLIVVDGAKVERWDVPSDQKIELL